MPTLQRVQLPTNKATPTLGANRTQPGARLTKKSKCLINSIPIAQRGRLAWGYTYGVAPQQAAISLSDVFADKMIEQINAARGKVILEMSGNDIDNEITELKFEGLSLLPRTPEDHTHDTITITDDRWRWPNKSVHKTYNLVRKANDFFVFGRATAAVRPTLHEAKKYYVQWTINPETDAPWTALEIVIDVLVNFLGYDETSIDISNAQLSNYIPPNIVLEGLKAHSVISRFLAESDNNLYVEETGKIVITKERVPFGRKQFDRILTPALRGQVTGELYVVDRQALRPTDIFFAVEPEFEILLTYLERGSTTTDSSSSPATTMEQALTQIKNRRIYVQNVTKTVVDKQVGKLPRGTIVTIEQALTAFGLKFGSKAITLEQFREFYGIDGSAVFNTVLTDPVNNVDFDPQAIAAWAQIVRDYRTTFRVPPIVLQYIKKLNNVLVDIINPESGKRKPSEVFSQITWVVNVNARLNKARKKGIELDSFGNLTAKGKFHPVPLLTSSIDMDFGTYQIQGLDDVNQPGVVTNMIRGRPAVDGFLNDNFAEGETELDRSSLYGAHGLKADWEMSTVVSATLLPKDNESVKWYNPDPPEDIPRGNGPLVEVRLNYDTARFALNEPGLKQYRETSEPAFVNEELINAIVTQAGNRRWATFSDQIQGNVEFALSTEAKKLRPQGPVSAIQHVFNGASGAIRTRFSATPISEGRDIRNLLDQEELQVVFKQVHLDTTIGTR